MGAREFEIVKGAMLRIDPLAGDSLRVRSGEVWVTQFEDPNDYMLKTGDSLTLNGKGATLAIAYKPTLLDLFRKDPLRTESGGFRGNGIFERLYFRICKGKPDMIAGNAASAGGASRARP